MLQQVQLSRYRHRFGMDIQKGVFDFLTVEDRFTIALLLLAQEGFPSFQKPLRPQGNSTANPRPPQSMRTRAPFSFQT